MHWQAFWVLLLVGLLYLVVITLTYNWMIAGPRRWLLKSQIERIRAAIAVCRNPDPPEADSVGKIRDWLDTSLTDVSDSLSTGRRLFSTVPLNELMSIQQDLNALSRQQAYLVRNDDLPMYAESIFLRLGKDDVASEKSLRARFEIQLGNPSGRRIVIAQADELCHARDDVAMRAEYDRQRASLWLALVGLLGVIAVGSALDHVVTMLIGAVGGFLAPLVNATAPDTHQSTWGVRVLSPVGGALTAVGGLLIVDFLATESVDLLGAAFRGTWSNPTSVASLTIALLFGFSGKMFSSMAITASSQIARSSPPEDLKPPARTTPS